MNEFKIRDPIHGFVEFNEWEKQIIGHPVFQRLRRIRQLALTDMVFPGGLHTRFEHSLGVMHLATKMYESILNNDYNRTILKDNYGFNEAGFVRNKQIVRLAALLHDIGHAPLSHASEDLMQIDESTGKPLKHEDYTVCIIENCLKDVIENHQINKNNYNIKAEEVTGLIEGDPEKAGQVVFWKVIISGQLDADRSDYLLRDSLHTGVKYGVYDLDRLLSMLAIGEDLENKGELLLGIKEGGWHVAESVILARYQMFSQVYFHKTKRSFELIYNQAMKDIFGKIPSKDNLEEFLKWDDYHVIEKFKDHPENYWCKSLIQRKHLYMLHQTTEVPELNEVEDFIKIQKHLNEESVWVVEDDVEKVWYESKRDGESTNEIMIIGKNGICKPLSQHSRLVHNMGELKQMRLYVKQEEKNKALKIKEEALK